MCIILNAKWKHSISSHKHTKTTGKSNHQQWPTNPKHFCKLHACFKTCSVYVNLFFSNMYTHSTFITNWISRLHYVVKININYGHIFCWYHTCTEITNQTSADLKLFNLFIYWFALFIIDFQRTHNNKICMSAKVSNKVKGTEGLSQDNETAVIKIKRG